MYFKKKKVKVVPGSRYRYLDQSDSNFEHTVQYTVIVKPLSAMVLLLSGLSGPKVFLMYWYCSLNPNLRIKMYIFHPQVSK